MPPATWPPHPWLPTKPERCLASRRGAPWGLLVWHGDQDDFLPPFRPAAAFWALLPPLPLPLLCLLRLLPELFPPRLELPSAFEIAAARDLLIPFLRRPSYCLSFLTLEP